MRLYLPAKLVFALIFLYHTVGERIGLPHGMEEGLYALLPMTEDR